MVPDLADGLDAPWDAVLSLGEIVVDELSTTAASFFCSDVFFRWKSAELVLIIFLVTPIVLLELVPSDDGSAFDAFDVTGTTSVLTAAEVSVYGSGS